MAAEHSEHKPLKSILKTGDEPPRHVGGISLTVEEGHDAEKKEHKFVFVEGKDGAVVKDSAGNVIKEEEVKKSRKSNKEHQMISKKRPSVDSPSDQAADDIIATHENDDVKLEDPLPSPVEKKEEKKKKKGFFF